MTMATAKQATTTPHRIAIESMRHRPFGPSFYLARQRDATRHSRFATRELLLAIYETRFVMFSFRETGYADRIALASSGQTVFASHSVSACITKQSRNCPSTLICGVAQLDAK